MWMWEWHEDPPMCVRSWLYLVLGLSLRQAGSRSPLSASPTSALPIGIPRCLLVFPLLSYFLSYSWDLAIQYVDWLPRHSRPLGGFRSMKGSDSPKTHHLELAPHPWPWPHPEGQVYLEALVFGFWNSVFGFKARFIKVLRLISLCG